MQALRVSEGRRDLSCGQVQEILPKLEAVIFDLDGTLCDSISVIIACTRQTFEELSLPVPAKEQIMVQIGKKLPEALSALLPAEHKDLSAQALDTYLQLHHTHPEFKIDRLFPQLEPLFVKIKARGLKLGVASGRMSVGITHTLEHTCLGQYCDAWCAGDEVPSKPDPLMMQTVCRRLGVAPEHSLGVGDSGLDLEMYHNSKAYALGVQTGVWSGEALLTLSPQLLLPKASDLCSYL